MTAVHEHGHPHEHGHDHDEVPHTHGPAVVESAQHRGPSHDGSVVLDVGPGVGAVVLNVPVALVDVEIDIVGLDPGTVATHSRVRPRVLPAGIRYAAVYPGLPEGAYRIPALGAHPAVDLEVVGGTVVDATWA